MGRKKVPTLLKLGKLFGGGGRHGRPSGESGPSVHAVATAIGIAAVAKTVAYTRRVAAVALGLPDATRISDTLNVNFVTVPATSVGVAKSIQSAALRVVASAVGASTTNRSVGKPVIATATGVPLGTHDAPILNLDFTTGTVPAAVTVARAGNTATRVNSSGNIELINANLGRIDYDPVALVTYGLLVEEQRIQLLGTTEDMSALSGVNLTRTANQIAAPTGATTADKCLPTTASMQQHRVDHATVAANGTSGYTYSIFAKPGGYSWVHMRFQDANERWYDIGNFAAGTESNGTVNSPRVQNYGSSWGRASAWTTPSAASHTPRFNISTGDNGSTFTGDGTSFMYLWGIQLEAGKSPSSYIPNTGAAGTSVTRAADVCTVAASSLPGFSDTALSVMVYARTGLLTTEQQQTFWEIGDGTANNRVSLIRDTSQHVRWQVVASGTTYADLDHGVIAAETEFRTALSLIANSARSVIDEVSIPVTDETVTLPSSLSTATIWLGRDGAATAYANAWLRGVKIWNRQLSDMELRDATGAPAPEGAVLAFPGARGFGRFSVGGRGGSIIHVTNLNATGAGSFAAACTTAGARTVVFDVSGTIALSGAIYVDEPYMTIAGETAPAPGIQITGYEMTIRTHNIIMRHMVFRGSNTNRSSLVISTGTSVHDIIFDHVTAQWGHDENGATFSQNQPVPITNVSWQRCQFLEGLSGHGHLVAWFVSDCSFYRCLFANNYQRNPRIHSDTSVEIVNNVMYNCTSVGTNPEIFIGDSTAGTAKPCSASIINNYFITGPSGTQATSCIQVASGVWIGAAGDSKVYHTGNVSDTSRTIYTNSNAINPATTTQPFSSGITPIDTADTTLRDDVVANSGSRPTSRDAQIADVCAQVLAGTTSLPASTVAGFGGPVTYANNTSTYSEPADPQDDPDGDGWTNLEEDLHTKAAALVP